MSGDWIPVLERALIGLLFLVGFWGVAFKKHLIKKVFGLTLLNSAVVLLFIVEGSRIGGASPILEPGISNVADPLPQALMLTAIVVGVCVTALALALAVRLYKAAGSFHIDAVRRHLERHGL